MSTPWTLGCDAAAPQTLAAFWARALGYVKESGFDASDNASIIDPGGRGPAIGFLLVPEPKTAKNRMHIDVRVSMADGVTLEQREALIRNRVTDLVAAGATMVREELYAGDSGSVLGHVVMLDPEGNEFCIA